VVRRRQLRTAIEIAMAPGGVRHVVLTGLANEYGGFITTPEEYDSQQYEGASTIFPARTAHACARD
jgi:neutral ceramidase